MSLLSDLADGTVTVEQAREQLQEHPPPWVEAREDGLVDVTFVHDEGDGPPLEEVRLMAPGHRHSGDTDLMPRVGESPLHAGTWALRADLVTGYVFLTRRGDHVEMVADASNPAPAQTDPRLRMSVLALPEAPALPWQARPAAAVVHEHLFDSHVLGNQRRVWVSPPPEPNAGGRVVVVLDGTADHAAPGVRDALSEAASVRGLTVVLVDPLDRRDVEMCADPGFSALLVEELLPWLQEAYGISTDPRDVALSGSSLGGLCALWTALHHPRAIGNVLLQSPSCWWYPGVDAPDARRLGLGPVTPTAIATAQAEPKRAVRIYHECGATEYGPPPAAIPQVLGNRWLHDVLELKGYETAYREFPGGHDATWWRGTWGSGVEWIFGGR